MRCPRTDKGKRIMKQKQAWRLVLMVSLIMCEAAQAQDGVACEDHNYCDVMLGRYRCDQDVGAFLSTIADGTLKSEVCPVTCEDPACSPPTDGSDPTAAGLANPTAWVPLPGEPLARGSTGMFALHLAPRGQSPRARVEAMLSRNNI